MSIANNNIDNHVDEEIFQCLNINKPKSFFLFAGAGSGKTRSLVNVLSRIDSEYGLILRKNRQRVAIITYTNAACDEIKHRLDFNPLFIVLTIHSFVWELIKDHTNDIKDWLRINLQEEIAELNAQQLKSRGVNKSSIDREKKIDSKTKRLQGLGNIIRFTYNPNGDKITKDSLNHSEVIYIGAYFLLHKKLMQSILSTRFPILLIDESQDTKKELIDAFFEVQKNNSDHFSLGLFGDTMQRIYNDGKESLGDDLPEDWKTPKKKMNHRCPKRIIKLINKIRSNVDKQIQEPRSDKEEGLVRLFIVSSSTADKSAIEQQIADKMAAITQDTLWTGAEKKVKVLTLEHHMAAKRMGFIELYEPLYKVERFRTGLLDGTLPGIRLFTQIILPLVLAKQEANEFEVINIVKKYSPHFRQEVFKLSEKPMDIIKTSNIRVNELLSLWKNNADPKLIDIISNLVGTGLFIIPDSLLPIAMRTQEEKELIEQSEDQEEEELEGYDEQIAAWDFALQVPFSQIIKYNEYVTDNAMFGTHQGVKGLQFPRVAVVLDDEEARGFLFSYEKLFGVKAQTDNDKKNIAEGKETSIDRTRRLFYVTCSRAEKSLAIIAYTANPDALRKKVLTEEWFIEDEIEAF